jgi:hypothetical protein
MWFRKIGIACLFLASVMLISAPSFAGTKLAVKQKFANRNVAGGAGTWLGLASVQITVPGPGSVVVTADGMAIFNSDAFLTVSLGAKNTFQDGDWLFTLSPGPAPNLNYQTYCARMVFPVSAAGTYTFYFRGISDHPSQPGKITVQTGSMTAEFYSKANVQGQAVQAVQESETDQAAPESNGERVISELPIN